VRGEGGWGGAARAPPPPAPPPPPRRMRLGGVTVQVTPNGNLGRGFADLGGLPAGVMAPPRPVPPLAQPRAPKHYSPSLSLGPPVGLEPQRQREASQTAESEQQVCLVSLSLSLSLPSFVLHCLRSSLL
jgi:hypothetical protein